MVEVFVERQAQKPVSPVKVRERTSSVAAITLKKLKGAFTSAVGQSEIYLSHLNISPQVVLEKVIFEYVMKLRNIHLSPDQDDEVPIISTRHDIDLWSGKTLELWGSRRTEDFFRTINPADIAMSLEEMSTTLMCQKFIDIEQQHSTCRHHVDIIRGSDITDTDWNGVLVQLGHESTDGEGLFDNNEKGPTNSSGDLIKRQACLMDFLEKEKVYLCNLELVDAHLLQPLSKSSMLSKHDKSMMPKVKELLNVHKEFVTLLEQGIENDTVGRNLLTFPKKFNCYANYVKSHEEKSKHFKHLLQTDENFSEFVSNVKSRYIPNRLSFEDILIGPVQKVPRFCLIFNDLVKFTASDHTDMKYLQDCIPVYSNVARYLNEGIRKEKSQVSVLALVSQIANCPHDFAKSHRFIVAEYDVTEVGREDRKFRIHVCNDCVLLSRVKNDQLKFVDIYDYSNLDVVHCGDNEFSIHSNYSSERRAILRLGDPIMNHGHGRSSSVVSMSLSSVFTAKSDHAGLQNFVIHNFKSMKSNDIVQTIHTQKHAESPPTTKNVRNFLLQVNINNDSAFNVYSDLNAYNNQSSKSSIAVSIGECQNDCNIVPLMCTYDAKSKQLKLRNNVFGEMTNLDDVLPVLSQLSSIVDANGKSKSIELLQHHLSKLVYFHISKSAFMSKHVPQHVKAFDKSKRERRPSVADFFTHFAPSKSPSPTKMAAENNEESSGRHTRSLSTRLWNVLSLKTDNNELKPDEIKPSPLASEGDGNKSHDSIDDSNCLDENVTELTRDPSEISLPIVSSPTQRLVPRKPTKSRPLHRALFSNESSKEIEKEYVKSKRVISLPLMFNDFMARFQTNGRDASKLQTEDNDSELRDDSLIMKTAEMNTEAVYTVDTEVERLSERIRFLEQENYSHQQRERIYLKKFQEHGINLLEEYGNL